MTAVGTGPLGESVAAWTLAPLLLAALSLGLGLLMERAARTRLATALLVPAGFCALIVLVMPGYRLGAGVWLALPLTLLGALAGFWLGRAGLRRRLVPGPLALTAAATYALYLGAVVLAGGWTWTGYNFVNDTAVQLVLADWLSGTGASMPPGPPLLPQQSTTGEYLRVYLETAYPLGSHAALATLAALVPAPLPAVYQPFIASAAAFAALALAALARAAGLRPASAAAAGFVALAANLPYVYALQGNVKEVVMVAALATAAAVGRGAIDSPRPVGDTAVLAVALAAALSAFSAAAVPYVGAFVAVLLGATLLARDSTLRSRLLPAIAVGSLVLVLSSAATLVKIVRFGEVAEGTFSTGAAIEELGHLLRPLELIQITGIWLAEDYRLPVPPGEEWINTLLAAGVVVCCVGGVVLALRKREPGPLLMLFPALITLAVLESRTAPYATGKMLMLASPGVVLTAAVALGWLGARRRVLAAAAAVPLATGMLISDALAYHDVQLAPVDRLRALEQIGDRLAGEPRRQQEWILVDEHEEFAKYFLRRGRANVALELLTPYQVRDRLTIGLAPLSADVDQMTLEFLGSHPLIVQRRGPDSSRPPANYRRDGGNAFYDVWRRAGDVDVRAHVPIQAVYEGYGRPDCGEVEKLAAQARPGDELVAASAPAEVRFGLTDDRVPKGWPPHPWLPEARLPKTPGEARADLQFPGGRFRVWVLGSFGRPLEVRVDGRAVGRAVGINTSGEWLSAGEVSLPAGRHPVEIVRPGADAAPGDGSMLSLGPVVFQRIEPQRLIWTPPRQATESLCGRRLDWIELARRR